MCLQLAIHSGSTNKQPTRFNFHTPGRAFNNIGTTNDNRDSRINDTFGSDAKARIIKASRPLFVPQFPELRRRYRERIESKLQQLEDVLAEDELEQAHNGLDYDKKLDEAAKLLRKHGMNIVLANNVRIGTSPTF